MGFWRETAREEKGGRGNFNEKGPKFGEYEPTCGFSHKEEAQSCEARHLLKQKSS